MHAPSETLRHEHDAIERLLQAMDGMGAALDHGYRVPREDVEAALDAVAGFADARHHAKEEDVLFPVLRRVSPEAGAKLARELEGDHKAARKLAGTMRGEADAGERGDAEARADLARHARLYAKLLRAHIRLEDEKLLPLADALPPGEAREVAEAFERVEREKAREDAHGRHERAIHDLHGRYAHHH